jgi:hypothetical protein
VSDGGAFNGLFVPDSIVDATSDPAEAFVDRALDRYGADGT